MQVRCLATSTVGPPSHTHAYTATHHAPLGLALRAVEVFDHLRREGGAETTHLLDIYTYTTAISVCSSSQQLERALELAAEMRSRGISCNVHTYRCAWAQCVQSVHSRTACCRLFQCAGAAASIQKFKGGGILITPHLSTASYSALMNVCIKSNEVQLAQEVYKQVRRRLLLCKISSVHAPGAAGGCICRCF